MLTVTDVLSRKGSEVVCLPPMAPVKQGIALMVEREVGALVIRSGPLPLGIFSERDFVQKMARHGPEVLERPVKDVMAVNTPWVWPSDTLVSCMNLMTLHAVRHLPVIGSLRLCGIISIGDIVSELIADQEHELEWLHEYVMRLR
jgi:CBS domain-containing protein